jgi:hypothetical protein
MNNLPESLLMIIAEYAIKSNAEKKNKKTKRNAQKFENYLNSWSFRIGHSIDKLKGRIGLQTDPFYAIHLLREPCLPLVDFSLTHEDWTTFSKEDVNKLKDILIKCI